MSKWKELFRKNSGLSPYVWIVFFILPFYFIGQSSSTNITILGIGLILLFFVCYFLALLSSGWLVYLWTSIQIALSIVMGFIYNYIYFSLFLAFFIGQLKNRIAFFILYGIHIAATWASINYLLIAQTQLFLSQLPFVFLSLVAVILLPVNNYNKNKEERLQGALDDANKRIAEFVKMEERQRISRDLHDTLGQKLSLIGLKSDLAGKLIAKNPAQAQIEIQDVRQTARSALKELRELVTQMRGVKLVDEIEHAATILGAANIELDLVGDAKLQHTSLIAENVISMCLKEAITNVVKHSDATSCRLEIVTTETELKISLHDNGTGIRMPVGGLLEMKGHGLRGMKERLEFVNGSLEVYSSPEVDGTLIVMRVPHSTKPAEKELSL